ncbi:hypothetical protein [Reichenbachiella sp. MALMAid0571]|uniref:hypothetical protein n=1 Tax=Reichenbachiella sp. MALMAid0571 TaxID=3143939 RepID=UPI0032E0487E
MKQRVLLGVLFFSIFQNLVLAQELTIVAYNVEFSRTAKYSKITDLHAPLKPDIIGFSEVPNGGWTKKVVYGNHILQYPQLTHKHYGRFKSILSKHPIVEGRDVVTQGDGWKPTGAICGIIISEGDTVTVYSLHVPTGIKDSLTSASFDLIKYLELNHRVNDKVILAGYFNDVNYSQSMNLYYKNGFEST